MPHIPPLAFTKDGEPFEVHDDAVAWRICKMANRGKPAVVMTQNGPLLLPIDATGDDLARLVHPGKYRLDPVDDEGAALQTQPAYAVVGEQPKTITDTGSAGSDELVARLLDQNDRMFRTVTECMQVMTSKYVDVMNSAARLLEAADKSGMTRAPKPPTPPIVVEKEAKEANDDNSGDAMPKWAEQLITTFAPLIYQKVAGIPTAPPVAPA